MNSKLRRWPLIAAIAVMALIAGGIGNSDLTSSLFASDNTGGLIEACSNGQHTRIVSDHEKCKKNEDGISWDSLDTQLTGAQVVAAVEGGSINLASGSTLNSVAISTEPDEDTQLTGAQVVAAVEGGSINLASGSTLNSVAISTEPDEDTQYDGTNFALSNQTCSVGQVVTGVAADGAVNCATDASGTSSWTDASGQVTATVNVGIGTASPSADLHVVGDARVTGSYRDSSNSSGTSGQVLSSTGGGTDWVDAAPAVENWQPVTLLSPWINYFPGTL